MINNNNNKVQTLKFWLRWTRSSKKIGVNQLKKTKLIYCETFQAGKHDVIVKNIHDLLAKLAWDFSADQLDHLFECFQVSPCKYPVEKNMTY